MCELFPTPRSPWSSGRATLGRWGLLALVLLASGAGAQTARIVLRWSEIIGARAYELQIARDSGFAEVVLQTRTATPAYRWEHLPAQIHWWRVRSIDADGRSSEWSAPLTVSLDSAVPEILRPHEGAKLPCGGAVEAALAPSVLAKEYLLELSSTADFATPTLLRQATPGFVLGALTPGPWYVRVSAIDLRDRKVGPGPTRSFAVRLSAPKLKAAADVWLGAAAQVALTWGQVACATSYLVEVVDETKERTSMSALEPRLRFKPTTAADYRWRVAGVDSAGTTGDWSSDASFRVKLPAPQPKGEQVRLGGVELSWLGVPTAVSYRVEVTSEQPGLPARESSTPQTQWRTAELAVGRYRWRVQAKDARGHSSPFSVPRAFARLPAAVLPAPQLLPGPTDVGVGSPLEVSWGPIAGVTAYQVELDGEALSVLQGTALRTPPLAEGWHRLRVRALAPPLEPSPYSAALEVFSGVPPVEGANVEAGEGATVRVELVDRLGRRVRATTPSFAAKYGALEQVEQQNGLWTMRWRAPLSGNDVLVIDSRDFHAEHPLRHRRSPVWLAANVGLVGNGGAVLSPWAVVGVGTRLPVLDERLGLELRMGVYRAGASAVVGGVTYRAWAWLLPASFLVSWLTPLREWLFRAAVGPSLQVAVGGVDEAREVSAVLGVEAAASVSRSLGPGRVELELGFLYARLDSTLARLNAGGVGVRVGYVLDL